MAASERRETDVYRAARRGRLGIRCPAMTEDELRGHARPTDADASATEELGPLGRPNTPGQSRTEDLGASTSSGWVTTEVAARSVRVSPRTIRRLIDRGDLKLELKVKA